MVGHRAMSKGTLPLNDLSGGAGRVDVLIRALMSALLTSHGLRKDTEVVLHMMGGPGPARRIKFDGATLRGLHAEERSIAGTLGKVLNIPLPPIGRWQPVTAGIEHSGGILKHTLKEWKDTVAVGLDANAPRLWTDKAVLPQTSKANNLNIGLVLSDDQPLSEEEKNGLLLRSLGDTWLQGHMAVGIVHFVLDEGVDLNLG